MKKGKSSTIKGYKNFKCSYGTVDSKNLKSIYLNIQSWVQPKKNYDNWTNVVSQIKRNIKLLLNEIIDQFLFDKKYIIDLDLRTSGINMNKKSFLNLEITLFVKQEIDFKSIKLKSSLKNVVDAINCDVFKKSPIFSFNLTKSDKITKLQTV